MEEHVERKSADHACAALHKLQSLLARAPTFPLRSDEFIKNQTCWKEPCVKSLHPLVPAQMRIRGFPLYSGNSYKHLNRFDASTPLPLGTHC